MFSVYKHKKPDFSLPPLTFSAHKGTNGHIGVIASSFGMEGAGLLCAQSALRCGAGKVSLLVPPECAVFYSARRPEVMLCAKGFDALDEFIADKDAIVFGCGVGREACIKTHLEALIERCTVPLVIDADGLFYLSADMLSGAKCPVLITPHMGEAARLFNIGVEQLKEKPVFYARRFASESNATVLLKSHFNIICTNEHAYIYHFGTPALATAGSGDVLAGICGAMAFRFAGDMDKAARCASFIHGCAGRFAGLKKGEYSCLAGDVSENIYSAIKLLCGD